MKRIDLERLALAHGVDAAVVTALDYNSLLIELQKKIREKAMLVPAGVDAADHDVDDAYEAACAEIMTDLGISFQVGDAAADIAVLVEVAPDPIQTNANGTVAAGFIEYTGKDGKQIFKLAPARHEKTRKAVAKLIHFAVKGDRTSKDGVKYQELIVTAVVYDQAGNGTQGNYSVNSSLLKKLNGQGAFKGIAMLEGVPVLNEGEVIFVYCEFGENIKNVTTWGSNDPLHIAAARALNKGVYVEKGETLAAVFHREDSSQENLNRFIGVADERTVARLMEKEMTSLELEYARKAQSKQLDLDFKGKELDAEVDLSAKKDKAIKSYLALGYSLEHAMLLIGK